MADDAKDVNEEVEITPDDFDADEKQDSSKAESSTADQEKPEVEKDSQQEQNSDDTPATDEEPSKEESNDEEADEQSEVESEKAEDTEDKPRGADKRKAELTNEIRDLVSQRNALRTEVEKVNAEVYQPATEDELVDQGYSATDAKVEALRQQIEVKDYNDRVAEAQLTLSSESERVINDFPIFNPESDQYEKELAEEAGNLLQANLITDPNTRQIVGSNVSPYQLYKTLAKAHGISAVKGQMKGQQDTAKMLANADTSVSATSAKPAKKDPLAEIWESPL